MAIPDVSDTLASLEQTLAGIEQVLDVPSLKLKADELEAAASAPDLWDDQVRAQEVTSQLSLVQGDIRRIE
ncbi:MAG: peptide chain release factor 2, partial [Candidatus Nanopelagicales bacterium]